MRQFVSKNDEIRRKNYVKKKENSKSVGRVNRGKKVFLKKGGQSANAKTIMDVLMLAGTQGTQITIEATGEDEQEVLDATVKLIAARFNESE